MFVENIDVQQRNPGFSRERVEATLRHYLGVEQVLWLERGLAGDDTHGHIDDTARFVNATTSGGVTWRGQAGVGCELWADAGEPAAAGEDAGCAGATIECGGVAAAIAGLF